MNLIWSFWEAIIRGDISYQTPKRRQNRTKLISENMSRQFMHNKQSQKKVISLTIKAFSGKIFVDPKKINVCFADHK